MRGRGGGHLARVKALSASARELGFPSPRLYTVVTRLNMRIGAVLRTVACSCAWCSDALTSSCSRCYMYGKDAC